LKIREAQGVEDFHKIDQIILDGIQVQVEIEGIQGKGQGVEEILVEDLLEEVLIRVEIKDRAEVVHREEDLVEEDLVRNPEEMVEDRREIILDQEEIPIMAHKEEEKILERIKVLGKRKDIKNKKGKVLVGDDGVI